MPTDTRVNLLTGRWLGKSSSGVRIYQTKRLRKTTHSSLGPARKKELPAHFVRVFGRPVEHDSNVLKRKVLSGTGIIEDLLNGLF
jgi:hypothetical protein